MASGVRELFERYVKAIAEQDFEALGQIVHPDVVVEYPQSGERLRGFASFRAQLENYPGGLPRGEAGVDSARILGDDERWVITPGYTVLPLAGPERYTTISRAAYPDGSHWWVVSIVEIKENRLVHAETYFAPEFEPPEWRRDLVDKSPREN